MKQLKDLQSWIVAYEKANDREPTIKEIKFKIKELIGQESKTKSSSKMYFRDCIWSDYKALRDSLIKDVDFVKEFKGVDLKAYIDDALVWSEKGNMTTENGWKLTLRKWMRTAKKEGKLIMLPDNAKPKGHINY
jgi:hypothetical protein